MARSKVSKKKFFVLVISLLFILLFAFLVVDGYFNFMSHEKVYISDAKEMIDQRMKSLLFQMNIFPQYIGDDLLFLSKLSSLGGILDPPDHNCMGDLEKDYLEFMKGNSYYQLIYINENGDEIVRIEHNGSDYGIVPENELQNKKYRQYFKDAINLTKEEIYLSGLDLNIEQGEIENRGTEENPIYIPTLRIATPVFKKNGTIGGVVVLNIYADYFLEDVRRSQRADEDVYLINKDGFYLSHPNQRREFSFMFEGNSNNFFEDYPEISEDILLNYAQRRIETDQLIFSFQQVHPTIGDVGLIEEPGKIAKSIAVEEYYWILVTISKKDVLNKAVERLKNDYFNFLLFSGILIVIIIALIFMFVFDFSFYKGVTK